MIVVVGRSGSFSYRVSDVVVGPSGGISYRG